MQFEVEFSVNLEMYSESLGNYIQKLSVDAIITSLPEDSHQFYITMPANHSAGIYPSLHNSICAFVAVMVAELVGMMQVEVSKKLLLSHGK